MIGTIFAAALTLAPVSGDAHYHPATLKPQTESVSPVERAYAGLTHQYHWTMFNQQTNLEIHELTAQNIILGGMVSRDIPGVEEQVSAVLRECQRERNGYIANVDAFARDLGTVEARIERTSPSPDYAKQKAGFHQVLDQHRRNLPQNCTTERVMADLRPILEMGK